MADESKGLQGVVVAETSLSTVDGERGKLTYRGYDIDDLAENASFEETAYLLWHGTLPTQSELASFQGELAKRRSLDPTLVELLTGPLAKASPMAALRTGVSALAAYVDEPRTTRDDALAHGLDILAKTPTIVATHARGRDGNNAVEPSADLDTAGAFLHALSGSEPTENARRAMDMALVLHADHGFNASTFSARVTASTLSDVYSAMASAIGTLKGALHGGANTNVMRMLEAIASVDDAVDHAKGMLERKERIPGFGHRVYKVMDPRAVHLKKLSRMLADETGETQWYEMTEAIQRYMSETKGLQPNVDLYSASVYRSLGVSTDLFTPIFAISRTAGWLAHVAEQYDANRLIRPRSEYVGERDLPWVPIEQRS